MHIYVLEQEERTTVETYDVISYFGFATLAILSNESAKILMIQVERPCLPN
jgi:hypothetical protein